jgi:hypothetical protein
MPQPQSRTKSLVRLVPVAPVSRPPWYTTKQAVSVADMLVAFRQASIAARYRAGQSVEPMGDH